MQRRDIREKLITICSYSLSSVIIFDNIPFLKLFSIAYFQLKYKSVTQFQRIWIVYLCVVIVFFFRFVNSKKVCILTCAMIINTH